MRRSVTLALALMVLLSAATAAHSWMLDQVKFSGSVGDGANTSYCVIDFGDASYAFKYNWDNAKTGWDMLNALKANGLDFEYKWGTFVSGISYDGHTRTGDGGAASNGYYWGYMISTDGAGFTESGSGSFERNLSNGSWDGWDWGTWPPAGPDVPMVPEPSSLLAMSSLIGLVGTVKLLRRK